MAGLARARGRFSTAEHHLRRFLDTAGPKLEPWRVRARQRLAAIEDERRLADPEALDGPLELETIRGNHFRLQLDARLGDVSRDYAAEVMGYLREARAEREERPSLFAIGGVDYRVAVSGDAQEERVDEARAQCRRHETIERAAATPVEQEEQDGKGEHGPHQVDPLRVGETEVAHGNLRGLV